MKIVLGSCREKKLKTVAGETEIILEGTPRFLTLPFPLSTRGAGWIESDKSACIWASLAAQAVKNLPAVQRTQVQSLSREDTLEQGMAAHSSILA